MTQEERDKQDKSDQALLLQRPEYLRFLFRVIQSAGIYQSTTNGADGRNLVSEGRRNLGLEILDMAENGQPITVSHPVGPLLTLIQVMREETQQPSTEKPNGRRYDRNNDIDDGSDPGE